MYKQLIKKLDSLPNKYEERFRDEKRLEVEALKDDLLKAQIIKDLSEQEYIKDFIEEKNKQLDSISDSILQLTFDMSSKNIRSIITLNGKADCIKEVITKFTPPDVQDIQDYIDNELKHIKENG